jgi:4-amino-4-deoxy-L-arabinose transferase-like glycosyltransferase
VVRAATLLRHDGLEKRMQIGNDSWDRAAYALFVAVALVILVTFRDYGVAWDEPEAQEYGQFILDYYRTDGARPRALTFNNMYYYGGLFEATAVWLGELLPFDPFATRHLLNAAVGLLGIVGAWKLGRTLGGPRAGFLAALFLAAVPSYYGHMFLNSKDIPFAAAAVWALYYTILLLRALPRPSLSLTLRIGLAIGLALGTRVGAVLLVVNLLAALAGWLALQAWQGAGGRALARSVAVIVARLAPAGILAYLLMIALWPWAQVDPLVRPFQAIQYFAHFPYDIPLLVDGELFRSSQPPWYYLPVFFGVKLPEFLVAFTVLALAGGAWRLLRTVRRDGLRTETARACLLEWGTVGFAALFPIGYAILSGSTLYDEMRHFLFVVPILAVVAAYWTARLLKRVVGWRPLLRDGLATLAIVYAAVHVYLMATLHPNQYVYYNALTGGVAGAQGKYDLDYWDNSLGELGEQLVDYAVNLYGERATSMPLRLRVCGHAPSLRPFVPAAWDTSSTVELADFYVSHTRFICGDAVNGPVVASVERLGSELSYAVDLGFTRNRLSAAVHGGPGPASALR